MSQPIINLKMVPAGVEYVLSLLNEQPRKVSNELFNEIATQYAQQMAQLRAPAPAPEPESVSNVWPAPAEMLPEPVSAD